MSMLYLSRLALKNPDVSYVSIWFQEDLLVFLLCLCAHMDHLWVNKLLTVLFSFISLRWDRKNNPEPWNKMEPTQQYKVLMVMHYLHKYLLIQAPHSLTFFIILYCQKRISFKGNTHRACYLVAKSVLPCHTDCTCLCVFPAVCS